MQTGKKKLVLDHVIVQKMDEKETGEDVSSILSFGARALFEQDGQENKDITCASMISSHLLDAHSETSHEQIPRTMLIA